MIKNKKTSWISLMVIILIAVVIGLKISQYDNFNYETSNTPRIEYKHQIRGVASYYDYILDNGWSSKGHFVCATRDFERYSYVKVTNIDTGQEVICKVTDYGPDESIHPDRIIDLSSTAFKTLAPLKLGLVDVRVEQLNEKGEQ